MRGLQADVELEETLRGNAGAADLATAASFLGKDVRGAEGGRVITGVVGRAYLDGGAAFLDVGGDALPLASISEVA